VERAPVPSDEKLPTTFFFRAWERASGRAERTVSAVNMSLPSPKDRDSISGCEHPAHAREHPSRQMRRWSAASRGVVWSGRVSVHHAASKTSRASLVGVSPGSAAFPTPLRHVSQCSPRQPPCGQLRERTWNGTLWISTRWEDLGTLHVLPWFGCSRMRFVWDGRVFSIVKRRGGACAARSRRAPPPRHCKAACCAVQRCGGAEVQRCNDAPAEGRLVACGTPATAAVAAPIAVAARAGGHRPARTPCRGSRRWPPPRSRCTGRRWGHAAAGATVAADRRRRRRRHRRYAPGAATTAAVHRRAAAARDGRSRYHRRDGRGGRGRGGARRPRTCHRRRLVAGGRSAVAATSERSGGQRRPVDAVAAAIAAATGAPCRQCLPKSRPTGAASRRPPAARAARHFGRPST